MTYKFRLCLVGLLLCSMPVFCFAWGETGHKAAAQIASERLTPEARKAVRELLGKESMVDVATWADQVRKQPRYKWSDSLHGAKISPGFDSFDSKRDCPNKGCAVSAIRRFAAVLRDKSASKEERTDALKFLIHFVVDIHQPVHAGGDGTKRAPSEVDFFGETVRYHKMWDSSILDRTKKSWEQYAKDLNAKITAKQVKDWSEKDPAPWVTESYRLACRAVQAVPADKRIGQEYCDMAIPMLEERLSMAGVRLALLLNDVFANPATQPAAGVSALAPAGR